LPGSAAITKDTEVLTLPKPQNASQKSSTKESKKLKIAVIFGGRSTEHRVSCVSASCIIKNLDKTKYDIVTVGITYRGDWLPYSGPASHIPGDKWVEEAYKENNFTPAEGHNSLDLALAAIQQCDCIFPVLHGYNGEDGTVQGLFELLGIPYVGCGVYASACGMDKAFAKVQFGKAGLPQVDYIIAYKDVFERDPAAYAAEVEARFGFPCFVKPANCGSSVGVGKVRSAAELPAALAEALKYDKKALIEPYVECREIECGVIGNSDASAFTPGEVRSTVTDFYDYDSKYVDGMNECIIPAAVPPEKLEEIKALAVKAFKAIEGAGLSRVDFFYKKDGTILLNEINTLPGFTECSMYPKLAVSDGVSYSELLDRLIALAFERHDADKRCFR
jgi:D-alanine-D-alanine ligase